MSTANVHGELADVWPRFQEKVQELNLALEPKRVEVDRFVDGLERESWQLILVLPKPHGETWDREAVFEARMQVARAFDELVAGSRHELPGTTLAVVTTDEALQEDVAEDEMPEEGEE